MDLDFSEFKLLVANMVDCTQLLDWFETTWNGSMRIYFQHRQQQAQEEHSATTFFDTDFARHFLIIWTFVKWQIIQEMIKIKASSHGLFNFIFLFYEFRNNFNSIYIHTCII